MEESVKASEGLLEQIRRSFDCPGQDVRTYSPLTLAYIGDAVYELVLRTAVVDQGNRPVNELNRRVTRLVKAPAQALMAEALLPSLTEEEEEVYRRGRNAKSYTSAKNATRGEYHKATGLEALFGYLYLTDRMERVLELIRRGLEAAGLAQEK